MAGGPKRVLIGVLFTALLTASGTSLAARGGVPGPPTFNKQNPHAKPRVDPDTVLVKLHQGQSAESLGLHGARSIAHTDWTVARAPGGAAKALGRLKHDKHVEVEPNYLATAFETPNDPLLAKSKQAYLAHVHLPDAWDHAHGDPALVIAVVDTGVDADTPDLAGRVLAGSDFVNDDSDASDDEGHGTMVAGI